MTLNTTVNRRSFLKSAISAGALVLAAPLSASSAAQLLTANNLSTDDAWSPHLF